MKGEAVSLPGDFEPLSETHPGVGRPCPLCDEPLRVGDRPALLEIGPAGEDDAAKAAAGRPYTAACDMVHERCAYLGDADD